MAGEECKPTDLLPGCAESFGRIFAQNDSTAEKIDAMREDLGRQVGRLFTLLEGNGQPGLIVRVDRMEQDRTNEHKRSGRTLALLAVVVSAVSALAAVIAIIYAIANG